MNQKEKAIELVDKMYNSEHCGIEHFPNKRYCDCIEMNFFQAKQCALIALDEIINSSPSAPILSDAGSFVNDIEESTEWWKGVRVEIEKLPA